ncbi:helix-turn-helix domain-containing protein [Radiobacillus sp. PE A8.2]|uniref:helix-turn-helix domain-containing protein n=1 Tax=Radiobacillus sp. PE A8.2 TaxID=3380349 RepID=UPI00388FEB6A
MESDSVDQVMDDLLKNLQVEPIESFYTECLPEWRELDYTPTYNKFYFICEGKGWLKIGDQEIRPVPGELCLMPALVQQSYSAVNDRPFHKYWCHFTATLAGLELFQWLDVPYSVNVRNRDELEHLFQQLVQLHAEPSFVRRFREKALILEIIALYLDSVPLRFHSDKIEELERLNRLQNFIEQNLAEPLSLDQIAKHVHLHPNYLIRYFQKYFATTPLKYVNRKKMEQAKILLSTTSSPISEVASQVGYSDANHFAKAFRRETSFSPKEFRMRTGRLEK